MRIAVIGGGISGLTAAYRLQADHDVTLFEAAAYIGGHTNTVEVDDHGQLLSVDTGFIVFNDRTYPNFTALLREWNVMAQPTTMSFSVRCDRRGWEYRGVDWNGIFAQRRNLFNWKFLRMLREFLKFSRVAKELIATDNDELTVADFLAQHGFSREFHECYFLPMGSAVWSCPRESFENFPARFVAEFYQHHGMLSVWDRPQWQVIRGGSSTYVHAALAKFHGRVMLGTPVARIKRTDDEVTLHTARGEFEFDHVIFACHADQALSILGEQSTAAEREILSAFPYEKNEVVLHTDTSLLPRSPRAWACWNYHVPQEKQEKCTVTYNMNLLQSLAARETYLVTLNASESIDPARILRRFTYHHPVFSRTRSAAQRRQGELLNARRISFCGAYWRNGFHEDGVVSALAVCHALQGTSRHAELSLRGMGQPSALAAH